MDKIIQHNLHWKFVSLGLAVLLWLFVINTENPVQMQDIKGIPVEIIGLTNIENKGLVIQNMEDLTNLELDLNLQGQRLDIEQINANKDTLITANINLTNYATDLNPNTSVAERFVPISVMVMVDGVIIEDYSPKSLNVIFEMEASKTFTIEYNIQGKEDNQYITLDPVIKTTQVTLTGAESIIETISKVVVDVNVDNFSEDTLTYTLPITVLDDEGNELLGLKKSIETVEVILPIGKKKAVSLQAQFTGQLPAGYVHSNTIVIPGEITILGKEEIIDSIQTISLSEISLSNLISNYTAQVEFIMPEGVEYIDRIDNNAVVIIEITKISTYEFVINTNTIKFDVTGLQDGLEYNIVQPEISIQLGGASEVLLEFDKDNVIIDFDLENLGIGEHTIPINLSLSNNLQLVNGPLMLETRPRRCQMKSTSRITTKILTLF